MKYLKVSYVANGSINWYNYLRKLLNTANACHMYTPYYIVYQWAYTERREYLGSCTRISIAAFIIHIAKTGNKCLFKGEKYWKAMNKNELPAYTQHGWTSHMMFLKKPDKVHPDSTYTKLKGQKTDERDIKRWSGWGVTSHETFI